MSEMSLEEQIRCMKEMKVYLEDFRLIMLQEMDKMRDQIDFLRSVGFSVETEKSYTQRYYTPARDNVEQVVADIGTRHFAYLDSVIEDLEHARDR